MVRWQRGLWLFCLPSFALLAIVLLWPLAYAVYLSFFDYYLGSEVRRFVGFGNYIGLLTNARLWNSIWTTVIIAFGSVALEFTVGLALALALPKVLLPGLALLLGLLPGLAPWLLPGLALG